MKIKYVLWVTAVAVFVGGCFAPPPTLIAVVLGFLSGAIVMALLNRGAYVRYR